MHCKHVHDLGGSNMMATQQQLLKESVNVWVLHSFTCEKRDVQQEVSDIYLQAYSNT
jgi:hypothetical protein